MDHRRESSRFAARDRRDKETDLFDEIKVLLPLVSEPTIIHVDRIALLRVAISLCKLRPLVANLLSHEFCNGLMEHLWSEDIIDKCLDGFVFIVDDHGTILYVTESVSSHLGLTQTDLVGRILRDYCQFEDYCQFCRLKNGDLVEEGAMFVMRIKTVVSPRGRRLNFKSALMKTVMFRLRTISDGGPMKLHLLQGAAVPPGVAHSFWATTKEHTHTFMTRHSCDMRFGFITNSVSQLLHLDAKSLAGSSFYDLVHPDDLSELSRSLRELFRKGHTRTSFYRLMDGHDNQVWIQTDASMVTHTSKGVVDKHVVCHHRVVGEQPVPHYWPPAIVPSELYSPSSSLTTGHLSPLGVFVDNKHLGKIERPHGGRQHMSPSLRSHSFDDLLQWLCRDFSNSSSPAIDSTVLSVHSTDSFENPRTNGGNGSSLRRAASVQPLPIFSPTTDHDYVFRSVLRSPSIPDIFLSVDRQSLSRSSTNGDDFSISSTNQPADDQLSRQSPHYAFKSPVEPFSIHASSMMSSHYDTVLSPDLADLQMLAPFVSTQTMVPVEGSILPLDLDVLRLIPDLNIDKWFPPSACVSEKIDQERRQTPSSSVVVDHDENDQLFDWNGLNDLKFFIDFQRDNEFRPNLFFNDTVDSSGPMSESRPNEESVDFSPFGHEFDASHFSLNLNE